MQDGLKHKKKKKKKKSADIFICRLSLVEYFTDKHFLLQVSASGCSHAGIGTLFSNEEQEKAGYEVWIYMINAEIWYFFATHADLATDETDIVESARQKMAASVASYMILIVLDFQTTLSNKSSMYTWLNSCGCSLLLLFH